RLLLLWPLLTVIVAGALVIESPQSHRLVMATPALALLAALALITLGNLILTALQQAPGTNAPLPDLSQWRLNLANWRKPTTQASLILLGLALVFALSDLMFYYGRFPSNNQFADPNTEIAYELSTYLNNLDGEWTAYLYGPPTLYVDFPTFPYLLTDFQAGANFFNVETADSQLASAPTTDRLFIFLPQRQGEMTLVQQQFPNGTFQHVNGYYAAPLFTVYLFEP
ncbi:MAG: hypothetical protein KC449_18755, partial [Anaerolineales bacterium]|nr:hypothetical protein [Anaerolineales bacterium]